MPGGLMAEPEAAAEAPEESGAWASHTHGGITSSSNHETADEIRENLEAEPAPEDGEPPDPEAEEKARLAKAAKDLGKKGGEAKAEKDAAEKKAAEKAAAEEKKAEEKPDDKAAEEKAEARRTSNRTTAKERVEQATREAAALKRERAQLIQERDEARHRLNALKASKGNGAALDDPSDPAPDPNQYEDTPEGARKLIRDEAAHAARMEHRRLLEEQETKTKEAEAEKRRTQAAEQYERIWTETLERHSQTMREAYEEDPQFGDKLAPEVASLVPSYVIHSEGGEVQPINALADEIIRAEHAKDVMLYLSGNPEVFQRIAALKSPRDIVREVAIIDARFSNAVTPVPAKRTESSKAPPPIRPVVGSPTTADPNELSDDLPTDEWFRRAQAAKRVRR